jgi:hypothetical protein
MPPPGHEPNMPPPGHEPNMPPPGGEGGEGGGPAAQDMSGKMINDGGHGANSGAEYDIKREKAEYEEKLADKMVECEANPTEFGSPTTNPIRVDDYCIGLIQTDPRSRVVEYSSKESRYLVHCKN